MGMVRAVGDVGGTLNRSLITVMMVMIMMITVSSLHVKDITLSPATVTLSVNVWVLQSDPGAEVLSIEKFLSQSRLRYAPYDTTVMGVEVDYEYHVHTLPADASSAYLDIVDSSNDIVNGVMHLHWNRTDEFLSYIHSETDAELFTASSSNIPIVIVLPNKNFPPHKFYTTSHLQCSQSYIGDAVFVDLSALSCDLSPTFGSDNVATSGSSLSNLWGDLFTSPDSFDLRHPGNVYTAAWVGGIAISAAHRFSIGGETEHFPAQSAERIMSPILFLKSRAARRQSDEENVGLSSAQLHTLQQWMQSLLLPSQSIEVLSSTHFIEDHPQLPIALASASRWQTLSTDDEDESPSPVPYIDSSHLLPELAQVGDNLCRRLLLDAGRGFEDDSLIQLESLFRTLQQGSQGPLDDWANEMGLYDDDYFATSELRHKTMFVPVFVLSDIQLAGFNLVDDKERGCEQLHPLFENGEAVQSTGSAVLVMHSNNTSINVYSSARGGWKRLDMSNALKGIAEGLSRAVAGIRPPQFPLPSDPSQSLDLTWVQGSHPFSPLGSLSPVREGVKGGVSGVIRWASRRGIALSRGVRVMNDLIQIVYQTSFLIEDIGRMLSLVYRPDSLVHRENVASADLSQDSGVDALLELVFAPVSAINESFENTEVIPGELKALLMELRDMLRVILEQIGDVMREMGDATSLLSVEHITTSEKQVGGYRSRIIQMEYQIRDLLERCTVVSKSGSRKSTSTLSSAGMNQRYIAAGICIFLLVCGVFLAKKLQESVEAKVKKLS